MEKSDNVGSAGPLSGSELFTDVALEACDETGIYQRHATPEEVIADVAQLREVDAHVEANEAKWRQRACTAIASMPLSIYQMVGLSKTVTKQAKVS